MIRRIKSHNLLNGIKFSIVEFLVISVLIGPFAIYYILHAQIINALVAGGITLNCLTVVAFGLRQWIDGEQGVGWRGLMDKQMRDRLSHENPHMFQDTMILTGSALIPFLLVLLVALDLVVQIKDRKN